MVITNFQVCNFTYYTYLHFNDQLHLSTIRHVVNILRFFHFQQLLLNITLYFIIKMQQEDGHTYKNNGKKNGVT